MFSGGTDSTLAAARMLERFERVTLLTCDPGYLFFLENTKVHVGALRERYGNARVEHVVLPIRDAVRQVLFAEVSYDLRRFSFSMASLVCLGCRLSMHAAALAFNLERGIPFIADGSVRIQDAIPEQMPSTLARNRRFYFERFGIYHTQPVYDVAASDRALEGLGLARQTRLKKQFILFDTQYTCPFGVPADVYARLFYKPLLGKTRERDSAEYSQRKFPRVLATVARRYGAERDLDARVAQFHAFHQHNETLAREAHDQQQALDRARAATQQASA
jgi:sulfur relay (sulfurtransferase) DsrF/TusC family protein